eukprot:TRINITY_DN43380_c0_g1_i2.p1 TRINITY_DN43380_c0_g1~~TRINITY_DN43380_c0_g1_i2.p1  ORF type:complete len:549 (+),score=61.60 TRINITY_DN43380_c0_g1_i2:189-1835(+)
MYKRGRISLIQSRRLVVVCVAMLGGRLWLNRRSLRLQNLSFLSESFAAINAEKVSEHETLRLVKRVGNKLVMIRICKGMAKKTWEREYDRTNGTTWTDVGEETHLDLTNKKIKKSVNVSGSLVTHLKHIHIKDFAEACLNPQTSSGSKAYSDAWQVWHIDDELAKKSGSFWHGRDTDQLPLPMLAHKYSDASLKAIEAPNLIWQPKLDGLRCVVSIQSAAARKAINLPPSIDNKIKTAGERHIPWFRPQVYTRNRKLLDHIRESLQTELKELENLVRDEWGPVGEVFFDGELYRHDPNVSFQKLSSWVRRDPKNNDHDTRNTQQVQYHIFDWFSRIDDERNFSQRHEDLQDLFSKATETLSEKKETRRIRLVPAHRVDPQKANTAEELRSFLDEQRNQSVKESYEGIMVRDGSKRYEISNPNPPAKTPKRSSGLLKSKPTLDGEFRIVNITVGEKGGRDEGALLYVCRAKNATFTVRPRGSIELRKDLWKNLTQDNRTRFNKEFLNKAYTVEYQNLQDSGVPRFPIGKELYPRADLDFTEEESKTDVS